MRMIGNVWLCENSNIYCVDANSVNTCSVCIGEIEAWKVYDYFKCGRDECMHFFIMVVWEKV